MSSERDGRRKRSRASWFVAIASALVVLLVPLAIIEARAQPGAELRVVPTGDRLSVEVVDGRHRILVMNAVRVDDARSALGRLARPWEDGAHTIIAPGDEFAASGLWEAIRLLEPGQVFVVGVPGAGQTWSLIEQYTRDNEIALHYVSDPAVLKLDDLTLSLLPPSGGNTFAPGVIARGGDINIAIALGLEVPDVQAQILIASTNNVPHQSTQLLVTNKRQTFDTPFDYVQMDSSSRVSIRFGAGLVKISGGDYVAGVGHSQLAR